MQQKYCTSRLIMCTAGFVRCDYVNMYIICVLRPPHNASVSLISLLMVVLTDVPRESVIWKAIL